MELATLYRDIVERSPDAFWVCDLDGRTIYANAAMCALYGAAADEMADVTVFDSLDEQGRAQFVEHLEHLKQHGGTGEDVDVLFWRRDGTSLWVVLSESELRGPDGEIVGFTHRISDNSSRRRALDELRESREQLAEAHRIARLGSWHWDLTTDAIHGSAELCELYGLDPAAFPISYADFLANVHPDDVASVDEAVREARHQASDFMFVARVRGQDGWVWTRGLGLSTPDDTGRVVAMSGTHLDITETKVADLALEDQVRQNTLMQAVAIAANEARTLREVLGQAQQLVLLHDDWRRGRAFLPDEIGAAVVPLHLTDADRAEDLATPEESARELELANRAFRARRSVWDDARLTIAVPVSHADEVCAVITITSAPPLSRFEMIQSMVEGVAVELGRVAERERAQRALADARDAAMEASRQKSEFLATMSHEIRTPLNGVIGLNDLLLRSELTPGQRQLASGVQVASRALLAIINDVLDFSKIEAGKLQLERVDFEVQAVFDQVASMLGESARAKDLELIVACHRDVPEMLCGDPTRLAQVLTNLGSNAVKFTATGEVVIRATAAPRADGGTELQVSVTDTGVGIVEDELTNLFEAFTQADASTTRRYGGTGLGLAISREIVEALGGEIGLRPNPGGGTVFWFTAQLEAPLGNGVDPDDEYARSWLAGRRVLVVDDNSALTLVERLARWNVRASSVADTDAAEVAVAEARRAGDPFEAVLLDLAVPARGGLELARALHADPANTGVRLVLLTSATAPTPEELTGAGVVACLTRPTPAGELRTTMLREVAGRDPRPDGVPHPIAEPTETRRILVVEDNPINQLVAVGILEALGYACATADDGEAAVREVRTGGYDAVLMDVQMPRLDGYAATRAIRAGQTTHVPVIAMTAAAVEGERERCLAAGMDDFLTKPVDTRALAAVLDRWIGRGASTVPRRTLRDVPANGGDSAGPHEVLELDRLDELRDLDPDSTAYLDRAIGNFVRNTPGTLAAVRQAVADDDATVLRQVAHKLAGGALNLGVFAAGRTAQEIEQIAGTGTTAGTAELADQLECQLETGRVALLAYQASYTTGSPAT